MNHPNQDEIMARLAELLDSDTDLDASEARALCREAGVSFDDLAELREVANAAELSGLLEATDFSETGSNDPDAGRVTEAFLAFSGGSGAESAASPQARQRISRWPAVLLALAAALALIVVAPWGRDSDDVRNLDGRAQLGSEAAGEALYLAPHSASIDLPIKLGIGDELMVTIEAQRANNAWWPLLERTIDQPKLTLREDEIASLKGVDLARIRWVRLSADGSRFSPAPRRLVLEKLAPR